MSKIIKLHNEAPISTQVEIYTQNGAVLSGIVHAHSDEYLEIRDSEGKIITIYESLIAGWKILSGVQAQSEVQNKESTTSPLDPIHEKMQRIIGKYAASSSLIKLDILAPNFQWPAAECLGTNAVKGRLLWDKASNGYRYADKIKELSPKFARLGPILLTLRQLEVLFPKAPAIKRHIGYIQYISGYIVDAATYYHKAALLSNCSADWFSLSALLHRGKQPEHAVTALLKGFSSAALNEHLSEWNLLVNLAYELQLYSVFEKITESKPARTETEKELLIEGFIVSLIRLERKADAVEILKDSAPFENGVRLVITKIQKMPKADSHLELSLPLIPLTTAIVETNQMTQTAPEVAGGAPLDTDELVGEIYTYSADKAYGFIKGPKGQRDLFFHKSMVKDHDLHERLQKDKWSGAKVSFHEVIGGKGPSAINIYLVRSSHDTYVAATKLAEAGDYSGATLLIRRLISGSASFKDSNELLGKWTEYAEKSAALPKGTDVYSRAKRAHLVEKNYELALRLYQETINENGPKHEAAIKDKANLLVQMQRPQDALDFFIANKHLLPSNRSSVYMLADFYKSAKRYGEASSAFAKVLEFQNTQQQTIFVLMQISYCQTQEGKASDAEATISRILSLQPKNRPARRFLAASHIARKDFAKAEALLAELLSESEDNYTNELQAKLTAAKEGAVISTNEILLDTRLSGQQSEASQFTEFAIKNCSLQGVHSEIIQGKRGPKQQDITELVDTARNMGSSRARDRGAYYLSAAKLCRDIGDGDSDQFYKYLGRSFASQGDAAVASGLSVDVAREFYIEALRNFNLCTNLRDEQDAANSIVRSLYSILGITQIRVINSGGRAQTIDAALEQILSKAPDTNIAFDFIGYLVSRSTLAAKRIVDALHKKRTIFTLAVDYLSKHGIVVESDVAEDFITGWAKLQETYRARYSSISSEIRAMLRGFMFAADSTNSYIAQLADAPEKLQLKLDQEYLSDILRILRLTANLLAETQFEEKDRLCTQISSQCEDTLNKIMRSPTRFSVEELLPLIEKVKSEEARFSDELYKTSTPVLSVKPPFDTFVPDAANKITVQVVISNQLGSAPAENLRIILEKDSDSFTPDTSELRVQAALRGGEETYAMLDLMLPQATLESKAFSLPFVIRYSTRQNMEEPDRAFSFSIRLNDDATFSPIDNPYAQFAESGVVEDKQMFYGRDELIASIAGNIAVSPVGKAIAIFGQKRAGKSSILYHLREKLLSDPNLLVIYIDNIGSIWDPNAKIPFTYQFLCAVLLKTITAVQRQGVPLSWSLSSTEFFSHPAPLIFFNEKFSSISSELRAKGKIKIKPVLLIDEFTYLYEGIRKGNIDPTIMTNLKAFLQAGYFSAVFVGQDTMPKFKMEFANEFGTVQDVRVSYLEQEDAIALIENPIRVPSPTGTMGESRYLENAADKVLDATAGSPFYIMMLCNRLVDYMNARRANKVTKADIGKVIDELVNGDKSIGIDKFDNLLTSGGADGSEGEDAYKVLSCIAKESVHGRCHHTRIEAETQKPVEQILEELCRREVLAMESGYYRIKVGLFRQWLLARTGGG